MGPMIGARTANGAMVMMRVSATFPRAASREVLKNSVPARPMVTNASPAAPAAVSSMRLARPVRLAPDAPVIRWTTLVVPRAAPAPARLLEWAADVTALAARRVAAQASSHPIVTSILRLAGDYETGSRPAASQSPHPGASMPQDEGQLLNVSPVRTRPREPDEICVQAVDLAGAGAEPVAWSLVPPQARVLSAIGRDDAVTRWYTSEHGPKSPLAHAAPAVCMSCGFFVRLGVPLGSLFGVCANEYAPDDGRVVSVDHGCGAHSEAVLPGSTDQPVPPVIDELGYDLMDLPGVSVDETVFESLDHPAGS